MGYTTVTTSQVSLRLSTDPHHFPSLGPILDFPHPWPVPLQS